jgi:hypothetical protein
VRVQVQSRALLSPVLLPVSNVVLLPLPARRRSAGCPQPGLSLVPKTQLSLVPKTRPGLVPRPLARVMPGI